MKRAIEENQAHIHQWVLNDDFSDEKCSCGGIRVSEEELQRRLEAWNEYQELVYKSEPYKDFLRMRKAFIEKDRATIKEIMAKIKERSHYELNEFGEPTLELNNPMPKPHFPNPATFPYVIGGEWKD